MASPATAFTTLGEEVVLLSAYQAVKEVVDAANTAAGGLGAKASDYLTALKAALADLAANPTTPTTTGGQAVLSAIAPYSLDPTLGTTIIGTVASQGNFAMPQPTAS